MLHRKLSLEKSQTRKWKIIAKNVPVVVYQFVHSKSHVALVIKQSIDTLFLQNKSCKIIKISNFLYKIVMCETIQTIDKQSFFFINVKNEMEVHLYIENTGFCSEAREQSKQVKPLISSFILLWHL